MSRMLLITLFLVLFGTFLGVLAVIGPPVPSAWAEDGRSAVAGFRAGEESILEVTLVDDGLSARIFALTNPMYRPDEQAGTAGNLRLDDRNDDEALRERPVLGLELLSGYRFEDGRWQGKIYDPKTGNTYTSRMWVDRDGRLKMRGYVGVPMLGRTVEYVPISDCPPQVPAMLALVDELPPSAAGCGE